MISYNKFTILLKQELLDPLFLIPQFYSPSFSTKIEDFVHNSYGAYGDEKRGNDFNGHVIWSHEEPLNKIDLENLSYKQFYNPLPLPECKEWHDIHMTPVHNMFYEINFNIFANSEISSLKNEWLKTFPRYARLYNWYFFFHGFVALDWFRDFKYLNNPYHYQLNKVFMCLNHLIENKRNYRLNLLAHLYEKNLTNYGLVSCPKLSKTLIKQELADPHSLLTIDSKFRILKNLLPNSDPLILDETNYNSASSDIPEYINYSIWSVVTETVFYDKKLHLTEKIFKPIVSKKPFILVGAYKNLEYLKSYGFKTFDRWIDESYDDEEDSDRRMEKIVAEIEKLCSLPFSELLDMYNKMQEILEYNHNHFYGKFKEIIIDELLHNFYACIKMYNNDLSERFRLPIENINFAKVKDVLLNC